MDKKQINEEKAEAKHAFNLLGELKPLFTTMRGKHYAWLEQSKHDEQEKREFVYMQLKALRAIEKHLQSVIDTGKMAEITEEMNSAG